MAYRLVMNLPYNTSLIWRETFDSSDAAATKQTALPEGFKVAAEEDLDLSKYIEVPLKMTKEEKEEEDTAADDLDCG